jgi:protein-disulfide isomerase
MGAKRRFAKVPALSSGFFAGLLLIGLLFIGCATTGISGAQEERIQRAYRPVPRGNPNGSISAFQYSDFACDHCSVGAQRMKQLIDIYPDDVRVYFKPVAIMANPQSMPAAKALLAAAAQGKFWEMHDAIFDNQKRLSPELYRELAQKLGLSLEDFEEDMLSPDLETIVRKNNQQLHTMGFKGVPAFIIEGKVIAGSHPLPVFVKIVDKVKRSRKAR